MRLSRPCYDKPWRCPGWTGGGMKYAKRDRCDSGYIVRLDGGQRVQYDGNWFFGRCERCDVITWPLAIRWFDPNWGVYKLSRLRYTISDLFNR